MNWLAIACADHVERGLKDGFMPVCHGKAGPLRRINPGDAVIYYSPTRVFGARDGLMSFTACGRAAARPPYAFDMGGGFVPFRRDVIWDRSARSAPIRPLLDRLELTRERSNWAYPFRFGLLPLSDDDCAVIHAAMGAAATSPYTSDQPWQAPLSLFDIVTEPGL